MLEEQRNLSADGLRGIASLNVTLAHFVCAFLPSVLHNHFPQIFPKNQSPSSMFLFIEHPLVSIFYNGSFAVIIFFVLSGYVLILPYWHQKNSIISQRFWGRYLRLNIPIAFSVILSYLLYKYNLYENVHAGDISGSSWFNAFFNLNKIEFIDVVKSAIYQAITRGNAIFNPPLWTLKIEFIGSLVLLGFYSIKPFKFDMSILMIVCFFLWAFFGTDSIYYMCFFFGAIIGKAKIAMIARFGLPIFMLGYFLGAFIYESPMYDWLPRTSYFDTKMIYNACGAILIVVSIVSGFGKNFFESSIPRFLGKISFSLYLIHFLVLSSVTSHLYIILPKSPFFIALNLIMYIILCLGLATVYTVLIDANAISFSKKVSSKILYKGN